MNLVITIMNSDITIIMLNHLKLKFSFINKDIIEQIKGGIRSGLSYVGCENLVELKKTKIEFLLITNNGFKESGSHNIKEL